MRRRWVSIRLLSKGIHGHIPSIGFFYAFNDNGNAKGNERNRTIKINTISDIIWELYSSFLDFGYAPNFFWNLSLQEAYEVIESKQRVNEREHEKEIYNLKTNLIFNSVLAKQIAENVACIFSKDAKVTDVYDLMPELFKEEREQAQIENAEAQWKLHKARFMAFSEEHNDKRKEE